MSRINQGPSRAVIGPDLHGDTLHSEAQYIANAADVGSVGQAVATSGFATLGTTDVELTAGIDRRVLAIFNNGAEILYVGVSGIAVANAYPIATGSQISFNATSGIRIWGKTSANTTDVRIIEFS